MTAADGSGRPDVSVLGDMLDQVRHAMSEAENTQRKLLEVTGTAWSDDRLIKVVVGPRGQLIELDIDPRVYRTPNSKALSAAILETARRAAADVMERATEIMTEHVPTDVRLGKIGSFDLPTMMNRTDAELAEASQPDAEDR
jgi:DNA-binding protein YbaB